MDEKLILRLVSAVARLEAVSDGGFITGASREISFDAAATDPSIIAYDDLISLFVGRVSAAAEKIGGQVLDVTKLIQEAFSVQKELLIKTKQAQEVIAQVTVMTEGRRSDFFNHLKAAADSLSALAWIAYMGKDCGMSMPIAHVEESWQTAEFYNKVLVEYKNKDPNHVQWAKSLKELYLPGLRDYVKSQYPLGPVWSATAIKTGSRPCQKLLDLVLLRQFQQHHSLLLNHPSLLPHTQKRGWLLFSRKLIQGNR